MARRVTSPLVLEELVKRYASRVALDRVSFTVGTGEVVGLLGPNGAGKSTALGVLATLLPFDAGRVTVAGHRLPDEAGAARRALGFVPQQIAIYPTLTARENLGFFARALGVRAVRAAVGAALERVGLADRADDPVTTFSIGMRRRLSLACGLLHAPRVVLLDEPAVGVDPQSRERVFDAVLDLARGGAAVLYSTHHMDEAERLCERVVLLDAGRVVAAGPPATLVRACGLLPRLRLRTADPLPPGWHAAVPGATVVDGTGPDVVVGIGDAAVVPLVLAAAARAGGAVLDVALHRPDLADAFFALTGRALRDDAA
jgi:ABC-2 type transport system ATP-binding protein